MNVGSDHVPAPSGHAPRLEAWDNDGFKGLLIRERDTDIADGRWIQAENPSEVQR
jgi:hypothetical protein